MNFSLDFSPLLPYWPVFLKGAWLTLKMTCVAVFFGMILGTLVAFVKRAKISVVSRLCSIYIEVVRNTPFLVQIFLLYFGLASFGIRMPTFVAACLAMVINIAAYAAEIIRSGLESVPGAATLAHLLACDAAALNRKGLSRTDQPVSVDDAGVGDRVANLGGRIDGNRQHRAIGYIPLARNVYRRRGALCGVVTADQIDRVGSGRARFQAQANHEACGGACR
jgi:His/Glu/Gln/Arg/opine family amino acid ABC transporter permease subunit